MKFPRLPRFFHKRSQSDSALYRRATAAHPDTLPPRPVSFSFSLPSTTTASTTTTATTTAGGSLSDFLSLVPTEPVDVGVSSSTTVASAATCSTGQISAASQPVVIDVLTRRILELQDELVRSACQKQEREQQEQEKEERQEQREQRESQDIPRNDRDRDENDARETIRDLEARQRRLEDEVSGLRRTLGETETTQTALRAENTRLRALLDLPLLTSLLPHIASSSSSSSSASSSSPSEADIEDALVSAIQRALRTPGSGNAWRRLLEPITGPRSPEDYIAQVNCTLRARREGRKWMQRAGFWKGWAREDGRCAGVVTPSASQLSDIVGQGGMGAVGEEVRVEVGMEVEVTVDGEESVPAPLEPGEEITQDALSTSANPEDATTATEAPLPGPYAHLPPLASVTFRESHSIRSHMSPSPKKEALLVHSASTLSQASVKSKHTPPASTSTSTKATPTKLTPTKIPADKGTDAHPLDASPTRTDTTTTSASASDLSSTSWDFLSSIIDRSLSFAASLHGTTATTVGDDHAHQTAPVLTHPVTTHSVTTSTTSPRTQNSAKTPTTSPSSSPSKKSRLPVLSFKPRTTTATTTTAPTRARAGTGTGTGTGTSMGVGIGMGTGTGTGAAGRLMRRLSKTISKPVLVDSTNAAAVGDSVPRLRVAAAAAVRKADMKGVTNSKEKEKENGKDKGRRRPVGETSSPLVKKKS